MQLEYKPDFEQCLKRFEAWWHCELIDRPLLTTWVQPRPGPALPVKQYASLRDQWMDVEFKIDAFEASLGRSSFLAETFPMFWPNLGPEVAATLFGSDQDFSEQSAWTHPSAGSCREILARKPNFETPYWQAVRRATALSLERGKSKWITGLTDLHTNGDLLAALRDPEQLCLEMIDDPEGVRLACEHVTRFVPAMYEDCWKLIKAAGQPSTTWMPFLHAGKSYATSCDFICMISPAMFEEAILPSLVDEMRYLDRNIFHLDGPGALKHLDALLAVPELNGVQWTYGAGNGPARKWMDVYKRIQAAGKNAFIGLDDWADLDAMIGNLRPEGVWLVGWLNPTLEQHADVLRRLEKWAAGKKR